MFPHHSPLSKFTRLAAFAALVASPLVGHAGGITWEIYDLIPGSTVQSLLDSGRLNGPPNATELITQRFDTFVVGNTYDHGDDYGSRIRGFVQVPVTGGYQFFLRSDDASQLFLSTDHTVAGASLIAEEMERGAPLFSGPRIAQRRSAPLLLEAGRSYYLEVLHKESSGTDYVEVGWERPDGTREHIPAAFLLPWAPDVGTPQFSVEPPDATVVAGDPLVLEPTVRAQPPATFQWFKDGQPLPAALGQSLIVAEASASDAGQYRLEVVSGAGITNSSRVATVNVAPDTTPPTLLAAHLDVKARQLRLGFSERLAPASISTPGAVSLNQGTTLSNPALDSTGRTLTFDVAGLADGQQNFQVSYNSLTDRAGNVIVADSAAVLILYRESFNQDAGFFTATRNAQTNGNSVGYSATVFAGGQPGELGGRLTRSTTPNPVYIADTNLGGPVSQAQPLLLKARLFVRNDNANGQFYFGYHQSDDPAGTGGLLGLRVNEPSSATRPNYRGILVVNGTQSPIFPLPADTALELDLAYDPATGVLSGRVGEQAVSVTGTPGSATYQSLFLGAFGLSTANPSQASYVYVDDVVYANGSVRLVDDPPPSTLLASLASPGNGEILATGQPAPLGVNIITTSETPVRVDYFAAPGAGLPQLVASVTNAPFAAHWTPAAPGQYSLSATVHAVAGGEFHSPVVEVEVVRPSPLLTVTEPFDGSVGRFTTTQRIGVGGNQLAFSPTSQAGGHAGELAGTLARTTLADAAYLGDAALGGFLYPGFQPLVLRGRLWLQNVAFNGTAFLGYVNRGDLNARLGLRLIEPGGAVAPAFRGALVAPGGIALEFAVPQFLPLEFDLAWDPATRVFGGTVNGQPVSAAFNHAPVAFDAVILGAYGANGNDEGAYLQVAVDDLTYNIVDPTQPPVLHLSRGPSGLVLSWSGTGFQLQSRASLTSGDWAAATETVVENNGQFEAAVTPAAAAWYWRLARP